MVLLEFCRKVVRRLRSKISKRVEKCKDLYKKIHQVHEKCQIPLVLKITDLPSKDQQMAHFQDRIQEDIEYIRKVEAFNEEDINHLVGKALVNTYLL